MTAVDGQLTRSTGILDMSRCTATLLRKVSRRLTQLYDTALMPEGITSTQFALLVEIARRAKEPPTLTELAKTMVMDRSGLGHGLKPLERDGLIALTEGHSDRRQRHIVLTAKGVAKVRRAEPLWSRADAHVGQVLGVDAASDLRARLMVIAHDERLSSGNFA